MSDNTTRYSSSGGDAIRGEQDPTTGTKTQVMKLSNEDGLITKQNPLAVRGPYWGPFISSFDGALDALIEQAERKDRRFKQRRKRGGGARISSYQSIIGQVDYPATLALSGWYRGSYTGKPWRPTPSAGISGTQGNLTETVPTPIQGAAQGGYTPADFDGISQELTTFTAGTQVGTYVTAGAGTVHVLFNCDVATTDDATNPHFNPQFFGVETGVTSCTLSFSNAGVRAGLLVAAAWVQLTVACSTGAYHFATMRWNSSTLEVRVDSGSWSTVACGAADALPASYIVQGISYNNTAFFDGRIMELETATTRHDDATCDNVKAYCNTRYGLSL